VEPGRTGRNREMKRSEPKIVGTDTEEPNRPPDRVLEVCAPESQVLVVSSISTRIPPFDASNHDIVNYSLLSSLIELFWAVIGAERG
jgi:hypothetical protein